MFETLQALAVARLQILLMRSRLLLGGAITVIKFTLEINVEDDLNAHDEIVRVLKSYEESVHSSQDLVGTTDRHDYFNEGTHALARCETLTPEQRENFVTNLRARGLHDAATMAALGMSPIWRNLQPKS